MTYTDVKLSQKLAYLRRLLNVRVRLMDYIDKVEVNILGNNIQVVWHTNPEAVKKISFTEEIEFPVSHLGKRIEHYKRKVRTEFKNRKKNFAKDLNVLSLQNETNNSNTDLGYSKKGLYLPSDDINTQSA